MNVADIKEAFYKRYDTSGSFLHYTFTGSHCVLLGHSNINGAPFLSCPLSMGVAMLARGLGGNVIKIQGAETDRIFSYIEGCPTGQFMGKSRDIAALLSKTQKYHPSGAEILYKSDIPRFLAQDAEFRLTLMKSLFKIGRKEFSAAQTAYISAGNNPITPYLALAYAKSGYCTITSSDMPQLRPLPMTGYKIVTAYIKDRDRQRSDRIYDALDAIRRRFPEVQTIADLSPVHAYYARQTFKSKRSADYIQHLADENMRISAAARGLKKCDIRSLFRAMNASQQSMEKYFNLKSSYSYLARLARETDGVMAVRCSDSGIVMLTETDKTDYAMKMIKNSFEYSMGYKPVLCVSDAV